MHLRFRKNLIFFNVSSFVRLVPETWMYSQERMAKKNVPLNNSQRALSKGDNGSK